LTDSKNLSQKRIDLEFRYVDYMVYENEDDYKIPEHALNRFKLLEIFVRIAIKKY